METHGRSRGEAEAKRELMLTAPVEKLICRLAVPSITIMLISALYNMADTYFVSSIGTSAIGGVGIVFPLMAMIQAIGFFFGHGSGNCVSRLLGAGREDEALRMAATGVASSVVGGILLGTIGTAFRPQFVAALGATETIAPYADEYMKYILFAAPLMTTSLTVNNLLRFQGSAFYGMIGMVSGAVMNIVLDPLLIFGLDMGVSGAAIATMASQAIGLAILLGGCGRHGNIPIRISRISVRLSVYSTIVRGGMPSLCRQGIASLSTVCMNRSAAPFGDAAIAALSIVMRTFLFANSALIGFGQGFQPVCGFSYGARRFDRVRRGYFFCVKVSSCALLALAAVGFAFAPNIISIFRADDADVVSIGALSLRFVCVPFATSGVVIMSNMMLQTIGFSARATLLAISRQGLFLLPLLYIMGPAFGLIGIQLCQPISDALTFLLSIPITASVLKEMKDRGDEGNA